MSNPWNVVSIDAARDRGRQGRHGPSESLVTKPAIAAYFAVTERTIERWMKLGMPYEKRVEGGCVRFRISDCGEWFSGGAAKTSARHENGGER